MNLICPMEVRCMAVPGTIAATVNAIENIAILKLLLRQAIAIPFLDAF